MKKLLDKPSAHGSRRPENGQLGQPTWDIAWLYPEQGNWSEEEYLDLPGNRLIEFCDGFLEFPPMPTTLHQWIVFYLIKQLDAFVEKKDLGWTLPAGLRVRLRRRKFREPDVVFMLRDHAQRIHKKFWSGADLVMEVVSGSPEDRRRDLVVKKAEYAKAKISEYWIVDPKRSAITVLWLNGTRY